MLWILFALSMFGGLFAIITFLTIFYHQIRSRFSDWQDLLYSGLGILVVFLVFVGSGFGLTIVEDKSYTETVQTAEYKLVSLQDTSQLTANGSRGLYYVRISMDTDEVYKFYYKLEDGGYKAGKIESENAIIYEKDDCIPTIIETTTYNKVDMNEILEFILSFGSFTRSEKSYTISVPKGTIIQDYYLDAQ